ncbi:MAG: class I SAM-dependent methyltransferase [Oxalobacteraceae bacterium]
MLLPEPSADALSASQALESLIREDIRAHQGWISFARFMELALYAKGLGYYAGGAAKLGKGGDFTTAPEMSPLFGATLAQFAASLDLASPLQVLEFGAGTGKLAEDFLSAAAATGLEVARYQIVELSGDLRERQRHRLSGRDQVGWLDAPPLTFSGLVLCNEVLDAMPVPLVVRRHGRWMELGVSLESECFAFRERAAAEDLCLHIPDSDSLPEGYVTEVHPQQAGFVRMLGDMLTSGAGGMAVLIDYGFPAREYYFSQRASGTLMCHYRHHAHTDPFYRLGLQDITAHVDFTQMGRAALEAGLQIAGYMNQAAFLLGAGLPQLLEQRQTEDASAWLPLVSAVQQLTSPAEMGELFKVLLLASRVDAPPAIAELDQSYRL